MNKKEEEFLEEFVKYKGEVYKTSSGSVIIKIEKEDLKNWITEHDKRERKRLIDDILEDNHFELLVFGIWMNGQCEGEDFKGLYKKFKKEIINKYK